MKNRIKKIVKENKEPIILGAIGALVGIITYTYTCRKMGYEMVKPMPYDETDQIFKTIGGMIIRVKRPEIES
jgi:hypothetical protein